MITSNHILLPKLLFLWLVWKYRLIIFNFVFHLTFFFFIQNLVFCVLDVFGFGFLLILNLIHNLLGLLNKSHLICDVILIWLAIFYIYYLFIFLNIFFFIIEILFFFYFFFRLIFIFIILINNILWLYISHR